MDLEQFIRIKLAELEQMAVFDVATETIRCWIDQYLEINN